MLFIVDRYILRRILTPLAATLSIGLVLLLAERMLGLLDNALGKKNAFAVVFQMLAYLAPHYLGLAIPAALFLGVLLGFSRMSQEREIDAFLASGVGLHRLALPVAILSVALMAGSLIALGWLQPYGRYAYRALVFDVANVEVFYLAEEGVFMQAGTRTFIFDRLDRTNSRFGSIFLYDDRGPRGGSETVTATHGQLIEGNAGPPVLRLENGHRIEVRPRPVPGSLAAPPSAIVGKFDIVDTPLSRVSDKAFRPRGKDERELTLPELLARQVDPPWDSNSNLMRAELHLRLIKILTIPILPFLAVPFALGRQRNQRAYRVGAALILIVVYNQFVEQGAIATGSTGASPWLTMWLPYAVLAAFAAWRFWQTSFGLSRDRLDPLFDRLALAGTALKRMVFIHQGLESRP